MDIRFIITWIRIDSLWLQKGYEKKLQVLSSDGLFVHIIHLYETYMNREGDIEYNHLGYSHTII